MNTPPGPAPNPTKAARRAPLFRAAAAALGLTVLAALTTHSSPAAADIFTYTDSEGVTHYSNRPAGDGKYKLYIKSTDKGAGAARERVTPVAPGDRTLERFHRYDTWIRQAATLYQIPEELVRAIIKCESDYDPRAVSPVGAQGLMQLMPETALRMQVRDAFDPRENIFGGTRYLRVLANLFNGDLDLTVAGYNAGEGAVARHGGIPPFAETQTYVTRVRTFYARYRAMDDIVAASIEP